MSRTGAPVIRSDWSAGMVRDVPRHMIPDNAVWLAQDVFIDQDGKLSKRGGTTAALSGALGSSVAASLVGVVNSSSQDAINRVIAFPVAGTSRNPIIFTPSSGTAAPTVPTGNVFSLSWTFPALPFPSGNNVLLPFSSTNAAGPVLLWGGSASTNYSGFNPTGTLQVTAGDPRITGFSAGDVANVSFVPGAYLQVSDNLAAQTRNDRYRITLVNTGSNYVEVEPTPTATYTGGTAVGGAASILNILPLTGNSTFSQYAGGVRTGTMHQNRAVYGNVTMVENPSTSHLQQYPARVAWGVLPTETLASNTGVTYGGLAYLGLIGVGQGTNNFVDVQGIDQVVSVVSYSDQALLVLGRGGAALLRGSLVTSTTANPSIGSFTVQVVNQGVGCMDAKSVQRTPVGVVFATNEGVYLFDGQRLLNVMDGRIRNLWINTILAGVTINGSATLFPNHYYLSTSAGGFLCNLDGFRWTTTTGLGVASAARDLSDNARCYFVRSGDTNDTNQAKIGKLDKIFAPTSANQADSHTGSAVLAQIQTKTDPTVLFSTLGSSRLRAFTDPSLLKKFKHVESTVKLVGGAATATVTATPGVEAEEASQVILTFNPAATVQVKRAQLYSPQVISHALGYTIQTTGACDSFDLLSTETDVVPLNIKRTA